jgi:histidinol dehydrogenase
MKRVNGYRAAKEMLTRKTSFDTGAESGVNAPASPGSSVRAILSDVYKNGDEAVRRYTRQFDGIDLETFEVTQDEVNDAFKKVDAKLISQLELAAGRIREYHAACMKSSGTSFIHQGVGRQILPMQRVGIYVPGGTAAYPSTVLMTAVPARVAGVDDIVITTPAQKDGSVPAITLIAAAIAGVNRIYKIGGAQAVAAMAFGTETVPAVDKICGPGNLYVAIAKKMVYGTVDIDSIAGPSEVIVVADDSASPAYCAADLMAQTEHEAMSSAILITTPLKIADAVENEIKKQSSKWSDVRSLQSARI